MALLLILFIILVPLALTIVLEYKIIQISFQKTLEHCKNLTSNFILINVITNVSLTAMNFLFNSFGSFTFITLFILELLIIFIEANMYLYCYTELSPKRAIVTSALANTFSATLGTTLLYGIVYINSYSGI